MGSVKDLQILKVPERDAEGLGRFTFSDRYSVFDWGEMPDHIRDKGKALCVTTAYFFERLAEMGVRTHYLGVVEDGRAKSLGELREPQDTMEVRLYRVLKPQLKGGSYDYSVYRRERGNFLIPLEVIYRNSLPEGSSVFRRLREGSLRPEELGLQEMPVPGAVLERPILDVSTKLEATDRYISWHEAQEIAGLTDEELQQIKETTLAIDDLITENARRLGLMHEDGKVEYAFDPARELTLVDALGTLDECRFTYEGIPVSKEIARIYYRKTEWYSHVQDAKRRDRVNWRALVALQPPSLPPELADAISFVYKAYANEVTGRTWFDTPPLREVLQTVKGLL